ncbi:MAG: SIMPL domain-containing protein [Candidatus Korobacteraceae bacterium]
MKRATFCFFLMVMFVGAVTAQQQVASSVQANTVSVSADGKFEAVPDTAIIQFNIAAQESSSNAAYDRASKAAEQVREVLRSNGIEPKEAHVGFFSLAPVYDYRTPQRKLIGYRVSTAVELKLKDFSKVGPIVEQLSGIDVTGNQSISYALENTDAAKIKAVEDAFHRARSEAEALAQAGGRSLGELRYASIDSVEYPRPFMPQPMIAMKAASAGAPAPTAEFSPQNATVTARVSALFALK